jgi:2-phospho-L-lactate guanylyltransferase
VLADRHETAFVPDVEGTGTTLLTAKRPALLQPKFGVGSASAHASSGAVRLAGWGLSRVRRDVDSVADLFEAARLGVGEHTRALMNEIDLAALEAADFAPTSLTSFESLVLEHIGGR